MSWTKNWSGLPPASAPPAYEDLPAEDAGHARALGEDDGFRCWVDINVVAHKIPGHAIVNISLKLIGGIPGDASSVQMRAVAEIAENRDG